MPHDCCCCQTLTLFSDLLSTMCPTHLVPQEACAFCGLILNIKIRHSNPCFKKAGARGNPFILANPKPGFRPHLNPDFGFAFFRHIMQWLKWSCEAGGGAHRTKPGWSE